MSIIRILSFFRLHVGKVPGGLRRTGLVVHKSRDRYYVEFNRLDREFALHTIRFSALSSQGRSYRYNGGLGRLKMFTMEKEKTTLTETLRSVFLEHSLELVTLEVFRDYGIPAEKTMDLSIFDNIPKYR